MSSVHPMPNTPLRRHRLTVVDYYKMGEAGIFQEKDRVELIEGEVIDMVPIGSRHAYTIDKLSYTIYKQIDEKILVRIQNPIRLDQYNEPEPDIALVTNQNYSDQHPGSADILLVIEVADSSLTYDLDIKTPLYARNNIPEAWVIDLNDKKIHVFLQPENGEYQTHNEINSGKLTPSLVTSFVLDLEELWSN